MSETVLRPHLPATLLPGSWTDREKQALQALLGLSFNEIEKLLREIVSARATPANGLFVRSHESTSWVVE